MGQEICFYGRRAAGKLGRRQLETRASPIAAVRSGALAPLLCAVWVVFSATVIGAEQWRPSGELAACVPLACRTQAQAQAQALARGEQRQPMANGKQQLPIAPVTLQ